MLLKTKDCLSILTISVDVEVERKHTSIQSKLSLFKLDAETYTKMISTHVIIIGDEEGTNSFSNSQIYCIVIDSPS
jgi:hypothetical protein